MDEINGDGGLAGELAQFENDQGLKINDEDE